MAGWRDRDGRHALAPGLRQRWETWWHTTGPGSGFGARRGLGRRLRLRRMLAAALAGLAVVLALAPPSGSAPTAAVVVAARDLAAGTVLAADDVLIRDLPPSAVPDGALPATAAALDRTLAAPLRRGEPLTDVRLVGPDLVRALAGADAASVPLRLPDPDVARVLRVGALVDVVAPGERHDQPAVLATAARVLAVLAPAGGDDDTDGRLIVVALDHAAATRVAAASLAQTLTVTVRSDPG